MTALSSEHVEFHCKVGGDPTPTITWRRQDGKMPIGRYDSQPFYFNSEIFFLNCAQNY